MNEDLFAEMDNAIGYKSPAQSGGVSEDLFAEMDSVLGVPSTQPTVQPSISNDQKVGMAMNSLMKRPSAVSGRIGAEALTPSLPFVSNIGGAASAGLSRISKGVDNAMNGETGTDRARGALGIASGALETIFAPVTGVVQSIGSVPGIKQGLQAIDSNVIQPTANAISDIQGVQNFAVANPNAEEVFSDATNVIGAFIGGAKAKPIRGAINDAVDTAGNVSNTVLRRAQELTSASEKSIESKIINQYEKAIKPTITGKGTAGQVKQYRENELSGVNAIKENQSLLKFTDEAGDVVEGQLPKNLEQFGEAVEQTKSSIYKKYSDISKQSGEAGLTVKMTSAIDELDAVINNKALDITHPETIRFAQEYQTRLRKNPEMGPEITEEIIKNINNDLKAFYRNPQSGEVSKMAVQALVVNKLRQSLEETISGATGKQYSALKRQYGSLVALEKDIVKASLRDARKNVKGLIDFSDILSGGQITSGLLSGNVALVGSGLAQKGIATFYKHLTNPNRGVKALFGDVDKLVKKRARSTQIDPSLSTKYLKADGKALSKKAEAWIDTNQEKLTDKVLLKNLSEESPKTYKEVREYLNGKRILDREKTLIEKIQDTPNKQGGFAKNPFEKKPKDTLAEGLQDEMRELDKFYPESIKVKNIHDEDIEVMDDFINKVRLDEEIPNSVFEKIEKLAERWDISMDLGLKKVADKLEDILSGKTKVKTTKPTGRKLNDGKL